MYFGKICIRKDSCCLCKLHYMESKGSNLQLNKKAKRNSDYILSIFILIRLLLKTFLYSVKRVGWLKAGNRTLVFNRLNSWSIKLFPSHYVSLKSVVNMEKRSGIWLRNFVPFKILIYAGVLHFFSQSLNVQNYEFIIITSKQSCLKYHLKWLIIWRSSRSAIKID